MSFFTVALRLICAVLFGGMIGLERERKRRPAGCRTYILVCVGATLTMLLSQYEYTMLTGAWSEIAEAIGITTDISRFGAQVINGIGFIGAGTIIVVGSQQVIGLTTAAALWASACVGLAIGAGFYWCFLIACPLIFLCIRIFPMVEAFVREKSRNMLIYIEFDSLNNVGAILGNIKDKQIRILDVEIEHEQGKKRRNPSVVLSLYLNLRQSHTLLISYLSEMECIYRIEEI